MREGLLWHICLLLLQNIPSTYPSRFRYLFYRLFHGNFVLDNPVSKKLLDFCPNRTEREFTHDGFTLPTRPLRSSSPYRTFHPQDHVQQRRRTLRTNSIHFLFSFATEFCDLQGEVIDYAWQPVSRTHLDRGLIKSRSNNRLRRTCCSYFLLYSCFRVLVLKASL